jgi:hypothetical protein
MRLLRLPEIACRTSLGYKRITYVNAKTHYLYPPSKEMKMLFSKLRKQLDSPPDMVCRDMSINKKLNKR